MPARILIIEDNPTNLELVVYLLTRFGHQIAYSNTGSDGVRQARDDRFALILCDIELPDISGFEIVRLLKADKELRHKPIEPQGLIDELDRYLAPEQRGVRQQRPVEPQALQR